MDYIIENDCLRVTVRSFGAEVVRVEDKDTGRELWWNGNPAFWVGFSPIKFNAFRGQLQGE